MRATGLNLKRVKAAVEELQRADAEQGLLRVTTNNSRVALLPRDDAVSKEEMVALERQVLAVDELKHPAARMLSAVVHGEIDSDREQNIAPGRPSAPSESAHTGAHQAGSGRAPVAERGGGFQSRPRHSPCREAETPGTLSPLNGRAQTTAMRCARGYPILRPPT